MRKRKTRKTLNPLHRCRFRVSALCFRFRCVRPLFHDGPHLLKMTARNRVRAPRRRQ